MPNLPDLSDHDDHQQTATDREIICAVCAPELTSMVRRWRFRAATGWAFAFFAIASMLVCWAWPSVVPGFGPSSHSPKAIWSDFAFRYPDSRQAKWVAWSENNDAPTISGKVQWSEKIQSGVLRFEGLPFLGSPVGSPSDEDSSESLGERADHDPGEYLDMVYQLWIVDNRSDGMVDAERVLISGGTFEVPMPTKPKGDHSSKGAKAKPVIVPFTPALEVHNVQEFLLTIEPRGGVWVSDLSRPVARAVFEAE